jgi:hypothetical protein
VDCPDGLNCFSFLSNCNVDLMPTAQPTISLAPTTFEPTTASPTITASPTTMPIGRDDMRFFFFCGTSWGDASSRCYKQCLSGHHSECPDFEQCFAQADCQKGVTEAKKPQKTPVPTIDGTGRPTASAIPTMSPTETSSPSVFTTKSPQLDPTMMPSSEYPTFKPTYAPCGGDPCPQFGHCRSAAGYCGPGEFYCNENSVWEESCGTPTDPPVSLSPTSSIRPSGLESAVPSLHPSKTPPTRSPAVSGSPSELVYSGNNTNHPTESLGVVNGTNGTEIVSSSPPSASATSSKGTGDFHPDDPAATFFCGTDWNHAITECPQRCPGGETSECPDDWSCYAFTPCVAVGVNTPPTLKPTWEPSMHPITTNPTTTNHYWSMQNKDTSPPAGYAWAAPPSNKPTYSPTLDQCRAPPCDYEFECRSGLGFCGTGIVYCNSASSWKPECNGNSQLALEASENSTSSNGEPSPAPTTSWDAWVKNKLNGGSKSDATKNDGSSSSPTKTPGNETEKATDTFNWFSDSTWATGEGGGDSWYRRSSARTDKATVLLPVLLGVTVWLL